MTREADAKALELKGNGLIWCSENPEELPSLSVHMREEGHLYLRAAAALRRLDGDDIIICPHCGHKWMPSELLLAEWVKHGVGCPEACRNCKGIYEIDFRTIFLFSTKKMELPPGNES